MSYKVEGYLRGVDEITLNEIRCTAIEAIKEYKTIIRYSSQGTNVDKEIVAAPQELLKEANDALHDLDPDRYPAPASRRGRSGYMRYVTSRPL